VLALKKRRDTEYKDAGGMPSIEEQFCKLQSLLSESNTVLSGCRLFHYHTRLCFWPKSVGGLFVDETLLISVQPYNIKCFIFVLSHTI